MLQNVYLWKLAEGGEAPLRPGETVSFAVRQPLDGAFSYQIYLRCRASARLTAAVRSDGERLGPDGALPLSDKWAWAKLGAVRWTKGEHRVDVTNLGSGEAVLQALLLTYDEDYVQCRRAAADAELLARGEEPDFSRAERFFAPCDPDNQRELRKRGFLERDGQKTSEGKCRCGVPLGGVGTGKVELDGQGVFTAITINNNFDVPIYRAPGSFFAVRWSGGGTSGARLLQTGGDADCPLPRVEAIDFTGVFPFAELGFRDAAFPFSLRLEAFSPLVPQDVENSSIPAACFRFTAENTADEPVSLSLLFSWENLIGTGGSMAHRAPAGAREAVIMNTWNPGYTWSDRTGTRQDAVSHPGASGLRFSSGSDHGCPESFGEYALLCEGEGIASGSWRLGADESAFWDGFSACGALPGDPGSRVGDEDGGYVAGAVCRTLVLPPRGKETVSFVLAWRMPFFLDAKGRDIGVRCAARFSSAEEAALRLLRRADALREETAAVRRELEDSSLPPRLSRKLINDLYPIVTNTWFDRDGHFAVNEAPTGMMGCLGTLDQKLCTGALYTNLFPSLDRTELLLFARCIGPDGSVSHDLGWGEFDLTPRGGTWSDLASSFVLQCWRFYLCTGDEAFFRKMYPKCKAAYRWQLSIDDDGNGIPDVGRGHGTTYDSYQWYGTSAFTASLWLCELLVLRDAAQRRSDPAFALECEAAFFRAQRSMLEELWTDAGDFGRYFKNYHDGPGETESRNCFLSQLAGQWFASLMNLGELLPAGCVGEALDTIAKRNVFVPGFPGLNDETTERGGFDWYQYAFLPYAETYYACLAIYENRVDDGLRCFEKIAALHESTPWNVALTYQADGRRGGLPYYITTPASLYLLDALSGFTADVPGHAMTVSPKLPGGALRVPLFTPAAWYRLEASESTESLRLRLSVSRVYRAGVWFERIIWKDPRLYGAKAIRLNGEAAQAEKRPEGVTVTLLWEPDERRPLELEAVL